MLPDQSDLHLAHYVVSLAKKGEPVFEDYFLLLRQILPLGFTILQLERRLSEGSGGVFSGEHYTLSQLAVILYTAFSRGSERNGMSVPLYGFLGE